MNIPHLSPVLTITEGLQTAQSAFSISTVFCLFSVTMASEQDSTALQDVTEATSVSTQLILVTD